MKESIRTIYQCDHCNKKYFVKWACELHEIKCYNNPENIKACFNCKFLEQINGESNEVHFVSGGDFDSRFEPVPTYYVCNKLNKKVYFPKAKHIGLVDKYPEHFEDQEPMPVQCESFEDVSISVDINHFPF